MTSVFEITGWNQVASFFVWTLAVCALAKAIFGSFLAAELQHRLARHDNPRRQRLARLQWEIGHQARWDPDVARGSPHAAAVPLSDAELEARRRELQTLARASLAGRALQYLLGCWACQTFWAAALIYAITVGVSAPTAWLISAAAYSGAAVLLSTLNSTSSAPRPAAAAPGRGGCKSCGH